MGARHGPQSAQIAEKSAFNVSDKIAIAGVSTIMIVPNHSPL